MQQWAAANPRLSGLLMLVMAPVLAGVNILALYTIERWYPVIFPLAGVAAFLGALQVITGVRPRSGEKVSIGYRVIAIVGMVAGAVLGVLANKWLMGEYL